ncbi:hypothetical protein [Halovivax cerinus]|uniref:Uncharacterized protein n=1 Tax=Halovivax cerinus TaxID=1487865 RepID=A0ABD5NRY7_9EURY|nr:hypothetical protein [Halovivax cerinus]
MRRTRHLCALLRPLVSKHRYGAPLSEDELIRQTAFEKHEEGAVRDAISYLRTQPFIQSFDTRGIRLDSSTFGRLADFLYQECDWPAWEITTKLKHYEGWDDHDWA